MKKKLLKKKNVRKLIDSGLICFFLLTISYVGVSLFNILSTTAPDFPSYYYATQDLLTHQNPYLDKRIPNIFIYPAATSVFYLPLLLFPYQIAQGIFIVLSVSAVPGIIFISLKLLYKNVSWRYLTFFTSLAFLFFPTKFTLGMGQVNLLALFFLMLGYYLYTLQKITKSALAIGIALLVKPILSFILFYFLFKRVWKLVSIIFLTIGILFLLSFWLYGTSAEWYYVTTIVPNLLQGTDGREVYYNQGLLGFFSRLTGNQLLSKTLSMFFSLLFIGYTFYLLIKKNLSGNYQFALFLTLLPIVHTLSWQHYFIFLMFPYMLLTKLLLEKKRYLYFPLLVLSYLLAGITIKEPILFIDLPLSLVLSHTFFGAVIVLILLFRLANDKNVVK